MITFKINGTKFPIPTEWSDVTYKQYIAIIDTKNSLLEHIALFTGIDKTILQNAELRNLEKISLALSFLSFPPKFEAKPSRMVGPYPMPTDVTLQSVGQFEDLRGLLTKMPKELATIEDNKLIADLYLEACAIYCQKIKYRSYDYTKVKEVKEELKNYSCIEVLQTGSFFLFRPLNSSAPTTTRFQNIRRRLKKLIQVFQASPKTSDLAQPSSRNPSA